MSIQTELARIKGAKADLKSWVEENGVTVPDGTLLDGLVTLAKTVETGGGGDDAAVVDALIDGSITEISNSMATIVNDYKFHGCKSLTTVDFPVATSIKQQAFYSCTNLTTVNFPVVTKVGNNMFENCKKLTVIDFPAATSIGAASFRYCSSLTTADFPAVGSINNVAFFECSKFTALILRKTDTVCTLSNTNAFTSTPIASGTGYIYVPSALVDSYKAATNWSTFADQIRAIEDYPDITGGAA